MSQQYSIIFKNNSMMSGSACVFQKNQGMLPPGTFSLAWFARFCNPGMQSNFSWAIDYSFVWGETGMLVPGVTFEASQQVPADLTSANQITLDYNGAFMFVGQTSASPAGSLYINETANIPMNTASVGIGMSGAGTFVTQAQPNMRLAFTPQPTYWMAFGNNYQQGQVLNTNAMGNIAQVMFPPNVYTMYVVLNPDNTWTVSPSPM